MKITYLAAVYRCEKNPARYVAIFPDIACFPNIESSYEDLHDDAERHLETVVYRYVDQNKPLPKPTKDYEELVKKVDPSYGEVGMVMPVTVCIKSKTVPVCVTIPEDYLKRIDDFVREFGMSRSVFLTMAAMEYIRKREDEN